MIEQIKHFTHVKLLRAQISQAPRFFITVCFILINKILLIKVIFKINNAEVNVFLLQEQNIYLKNEKMRY